VISIGEALVDALLLGIEVHPRVRRAVEWVTEVARPPEGVRLVVDDGAEYTGVVVVDANQPRLMFAVRRGKGSNAAAGQPKPPGERQRPARADAHGDDASCGDVPSYE
jgi:hypothetical protein